jgi:hypothetical protein
MTAHTGSTHFANPFIACMQCGRRVKTVDADLRNQPCGHRAEWNSVCPSWSPVDGCRCQQHLGHVSHGVPPE